MATLKEAFSHGYDKEKLRAALASGADPNEIVDAEGNPALIHLCHRTFASRLELMELLLQAGADPDIKDKKGRAVLHHAAASSIGTDHGTKIIALLTKYKANINVPNNLGDTPLHIAGDSCLRGYGTKNLIAVLNAGADIERRNNSGQTALEAMVATRKTAEAKENVQKIFNKYAAHQLALQKDHARDTQLQLKSLARKGTGFQLKKKP